MRRVGRSVHATSKRAERDRLERQFKDDVSDERFDPEKCLQRVNPLLSRACSGSCKVPVGEPKGYRASNCR